MVSEKTQPAMFFDTGCNKMLLFLPACSLILSVFVFFYTLSETLIAISRDANRRLMIDNLEQRQEKSVAFPRLQALFLLLPLSCAGWPD